jgi:hypothetical protein
VEEFVAQSAPIGFADESCMEVRLMAIKTRKCRNEGIVRYERTEICNIVKQGVLIYASIV